MAGLRDRAFLVYLGLSAILFAWHGVGAYRLRTELARLGPCVARGEVDCATESLARARFYSRDDPRVLLADVEVSIMLGEGHDVDKTLARLELRHREALGGELLLAQGDAAAARHEDVRARALWAKAAPMVDAPMLVDPRRARLERARGAERDVRAARTGDLRETFESLLSAGRDGRSDDAGKLRAAIAESIAGMPGEKRMALERALRAADRVLDLGRRRRSLGAGAPAGDPFPRAPPRRPTEDELARSPWKERAYRSAMEEYEHSARRYEEARYEHVRGHDRQVRAVVEELERACSDARKLLAEGLRA